MLITALDAVLEVWIAVFFGVAVHSTRPDSDIAPECALFTLRSSLLRNSSFQKRYGQIRPSTAVFGIFEGIDSSALRFSSDSAYFLILLSILPRNLPLPYSNSVNVFLKGVTARHIVMVRIELSGVFGSSPARVPGVDDVDHSITYC